MLDNGAIDIAISFNPGEASALIAQGRLPETVRTFVFDEGTIGNTHFVAIPYNAAHKDAAMVVANFLMSPEAQACKQDATVWGDQTVLSFSKLSAEQRALFADLPRGPATLPPNALGPSLAGAAPDLDDTDRGALAHPLWQLGRCTKSPSASIRVERSGSAHRLCRDGGETAWTSTWLAAIRPGLDAAAVPRPRRRGAGRGGAAGLRLYAGARRGRSEPRPLAAGWPPIRARAARSG